MTKPVPLPPDEALRIALAPIGLPKDTAPAVGDFERGAQAAWNSAVEQINTKLHYRRERCLGRYAPPEPALDSEINAAPEPTKGSRR